MTPVRFEQIIDEACKADTLADVTKTGFVALEMALGTNSVAFLPAIDKLCRRMRQLGYQAGEPRPREAGVAL